MPGNASSFNIVSYLQGILNSGEVLPSADQIKTVSGGYMQYPPTLIDQTPRTATIVTALLLLGSDGATIRHYELQLFKFKKLHGQWQLNPDWKKLTDNQANKLCETVAKLNSTVGITTSSAAYTIVNADTMRQVVEKLKTKSGEEELLGSIDKQDAALVQLKTRMATLKAIIAEIESNWENTSEEYWHQLLVDNPWLITQLFAYPVHVFGNKVYVGGKGVDNTGGNIADFLVQNPLSQHVAIVEIKTPTTPLIGSEYRDGICLPSRELAGGTVQTLTYRDSIYKAYNTLRTQQTVSGAHDFQVSNPNCILIIGDEDNLTEPSQKASFQIIRTSNPGLEVITFKELLAKAKLLLELLES